LELDWHIGIAVRFYVDATGKSVLLSVRGDIIGDLVGATDKLAKNRIGNPDVAVIAPVFTPTIQDFKNTAGPIVVITDHAQGMPPVVFFGVLRRPPNITTL
jgi:hypothetical protein